MTDNDVLHKGSSHLHAHINKSYKTKTTIQIPATTYCHSIVHISNSLSLRTVTFAYTELPMEQDHSMANQKR